MESKEPWFAGFGPYLTLGLQLALTVVVLFFVGQWLDGQFGTSPWLMLLGLLIGVTGGMIKFFMTAMQLGREEDAKNRSEKKE